MRNKGLFRGLLIVGLISATTIAAAEDVSETIKITDDADDVVTLETDLGERFKMDLVDFREGIRATVEVKDVSVIHPAEFLCLSGLQIVECVVVPPTFDIWGRVIAPGWYEEHVHECVDGEWTTTVTLVDGC